MAGKNNISIELVNQCFIYKDGSLYWKTRPREHFKSEHDCKAWNTRFADVEAGSLNFSETGNNWRCMVGLSGKNIRRSIIVWAMHHQCWPTFEIDHKDHVTLNDRIENLRPSSHSQNGGNQIKACNNTSGYKGVSWNKRVCRWQANIMVRKKAIYLGLFNTREEAHAAYKEAAIKYFGEFACFG